MGLRVIADQVTSRGNLSNEIRAFAHVATDQKKCRVCVMLIEKIEELGGDCGIWPVVEGDRELAWRRGAVSCPPKELRLRTSGAIGG